jgi:hypothetical protein
MRRFPCDLRSHKNVRQPTLPYPLFGPPHKFGADSQTSKFARYDETTDFPIGIRLQVVHLADLDPANHGVCAARNKDNPVLHSCPALDAQFQAGHRDGIAKFSAELGNYFDIEDLKFTDQQCLGVLMLTSQISVLFVATTNDWLALLHFFTIAHGSAKPMGPERGAVRRGRRTYPAMPQ